MPENPISNFPHGILNIVGSLKLIKKHKDPFGLVKELLSNAIEACLIKKDESKLDKISISIITKRDANENLSEIEIIDNGIGFNQKQWESFCCLGSTTKSEYKCKGAGRIQYWHHFNSVCIESSYLENGVLKGFSCVIESNDERVSFDTIQHLIKNSTTSCIQGTKIRLYNPKAEIPYMNFTDTGIHEKIFQELLPKLLHLKEIGTPFNININNEESCTITQNELPDPILACKEVSVNLRSLSDGIQIQEKASFLISVYRTQIKASHVVQLCVKDIAVENIVSEFMDKSLLNIKTQTGEFELIFIKDKQKNDGFLEKKLNAQRDAFDEFYFNYEEFLKHDQPSFFLEKDLFKEDLVEVVGIIIEEQGLFKFDKKTKPEIMKELRDSFLINEKLIQANNVRIKYGEDVKKVAKRVYNRIASDRIKCGLKEQEKVAQIEEIIKSALEDVANINTKNPNWRDELKKECEALAKITDEEKRLALTEHAYLRIKKENLLEKFIELDSIPANKEYKINQTESLIHNILFPQSENSFTAGKQDNDLWMINEDYSYYHTISHESLASYICPKTGKKLLSDDFESSFQNNESLSKYFSSGKKPDLAVFYDNESLVIIELKKPNEPLNEAISQVINYARIIASKMIKNDLGELPYNKFYLYAIGSKKMFYTIEGAYAERKLADGEGFFYPGGSLMTLDNVTNTGATYYLEIGSYERIVNQLKVRNKKYREILL